MRANFYRVDRDPIPCQKNLEHGYGHISLGSPEEDLSRTQLLHFAYYAPP